jgi:hypothetical protein
MDECSRCTDATLLTPPAENDWRRKQKGKDIERDGRIAQYKAERTPQPPKSAGRFEQRAAQSVKPLPI